MNVYFDDSPTRNGHSHRGIGAYARELKTALEAVAKTEIGFQLVNNPQAADVIHIPYFDLFSPTFPLSVITHKRKGKAVVVTIHDFIPLVFKEHYPVGLRGRLAHAYQRAALQLVDRFITDSQASKQDLIAYLQLNPKAIDPIYLGPGFTAVPPAPKEGHAYLSKLGISHPFFLYVGDINYNKNLPTLIEAFGSLSTPASLVLVGKNFRPQPIPEWRRIETAIDKLSQRQRDHLHLLTTIGQSEQDKQVLASLYSQAHAYVQPSLSEGFGLPVLEAMTFGTPPIVTTGGSLPEVVAKSGVVTAPTVEGLSQALAQSLNWDRSTRLKHQQAARTRAQEFTWQKTAQKTLASYQQALRK